jgi:hypothetical protein
VCEWGEWNDFLVTNDEQDELNGDCYSNLSKLTFSTVVTCSNPIFEVKRPINHISLTHNREQILETLMSDCDYLGGEMIMSEKSVSSH